MIKHTKKYIIILVVFILMLFMPNVEAATARISASSTSAYVGDSVTIYITYTAAAWNLTVSGNGVTTKKYADVTSDAENATKTASVKLNTSKAGTYTVKLTGDITDGTTGNTTNVNSSVKVTIKEKPVETEKETSTQNSNTNANTASSSSNQTSGSSNSGSNASSSNETKTNTSNNTSTTKTNKTEVKKTEETKKEVVKTTSEESANTEEQTLEETQTQELPFGISELTLYAINENGEKEKIELAPGFNINIFEYRCNVKSNINKIEIEKNANEYDGNLEIIGLEENLKDGENVIFLRMKKDDANVEYKLIVTKEAMQVVEMVQEETQENAVNENNINLEPIKKENKAIEFLKKYGLWIGITAILMGIEAGIFILIIKKRYVKKEI